MDLQQLENELSELDQRYREWVAPISVAAELELERKIGQDGYTQQDCEYEIDLIARRQWAIYNPKLASQSILEKILSAYILSIPIEREKIRAIAAKAVHTTDILLWYIQACTTQLRTSADAELFRNALTAASIQNFAFADYDEDIHWALTDLAIAAHNAGIDVNYHASTIAELSSNEITLGRRISMWQTLNNFSDLFLHQR